jgi:small subunit ribosomal protein S20
LFTLQKEIDVAHSLSARKRIRQNAKHRARNRAQKVQLKQVLRTFDETIKSGDPGKALESLKVTVRKIDRTAAKGTMHKHAAARKKSQLQKRVNALKTTGAKA